VLSHKLHWYVGAARTSDRCCLGLDFSPGLFTVRPAGSAGGTLGGTDRSRRVRLGHGVQPPNVYRPRVRAAPYRYSVDYFREAFMFGGEPPFMMVRWF